MKIKRPRHFRAYFHGVTQNPVGKTCLKITRSLQVASLALVRAMPWARQRLNLPKNAPLEATEPMPAKGLHITAAWRLPPFQRILPKLPEDHAALRFFASRVLEPANAAYVALLENGRAWGYGHGAVFTCEDRFLPAFSRDPWGAKRHAVWTRLWLPAPTPLPGRLLYLVTPEATCNYHHWLLDLLPRIGDVEKAGFRLSDFDVIVVNHAHLPYQWETLKQLGARQDQILAIDASTCLQPELMVVPSLPPSNETVTAEAIEFLRARLLPSKTKANRQRRIYLTRRDAPVRRLKNEEEIEKLVHSYGFETVVSTRLTVAQQAQTFSEAEIIIGSGANLANLVFATPGTRVIEFAAPRWLTVYHWMISARLGLDHTIVLAQGGDHVENPRIDYRQEDFSIDPKKLDRVLSALAKQLAITKTG